MFEWFCATGGCLATNGCLLCLWYNTLTETYFLSARVDHMEVIIKNQTEHLNRLDTNGLR